MLWQVVLLLIDNREPVAFVTYGHKGNQRTGIRRRALLLRAGHLEACLLNQPRGRGSNARDRDQKFWLLQSKPW